MTETLFGGPTLPPAYPERAAWGTAQKLRAWQQQALDLYFRTDPRDFLAVATPGAGKTTFALRVASGGPCSGMSGTGQPVSCFRLAAPGARY